MCALYVYTYIYLYYYNVLNTKRDITMFYSHDRFSRLRDDPTPRFGNPLYAYAYPRNPNWFRARLASKRADTMSATGCVTAAL